MEHIKRRKLYEEVTAGIIDIIKTNNMKKGDKIQSSDELCNLFGVSRMVIREALCALQSTGIIEVRHGSGNYLKDVDDLYREDLDLQTGKEHILNILEFRKGFEGQAVALAAERSSKEEQLELAAVLERMRQEISKGGNAASEDYNFHMHLISATHNPVFAKVFNEIIAANFFEGLKSGHQYFAKIFGPRIRVVEEHELILDYIVKRRPNEAREAMCDHLENVGTKLRRLFQAGRK
jgi:GntR family transcriptional repressor for pyruvate dehydrogenase complex